ncbi:hypothetical protein [Brevundimonas sp.]|uniref:Eco57I restriction-modification methylase domain-containing protein n=1 Tax=Brevundimonas sp. TaxID=1871086 RepID=UPI0026099276|nr:hypothetical protein [Brevundimonas sp.]
MTDRFLPTSLRRALERDIKAARKVAEDGVSDAIRRLGVADAEAPTHLSDEDKAARRRLRAHARALGDTVSDGIHTVDHLIEAAAYAQWHRRLFARFLAERGLLRHPDHGVAVTLDEAEELAAEEGFADGWSAAEAYAARMLPAVFQPTDPALALTLTPEHAQALRKLVLGLDPETFQAEDALGWTYQFWRALEKDRVNQAGNKIGARDLPAVTQLFTEPYMVKFLLHNTLGAWRAGKVLAARPELATGAADETALRAAVSPPGYAFDMLRFVRGNGDGPWMPAAGNFAGWPETAAAIRALDPCCGSGHFLTEMLAILAALRADEEGLSNTQAVAAVLSDNLFGLELDGRCVQIAAFAVALTAWRIGGFQPFGSEQVHIAWVGAPPPLDRGEFLALANGDDDLRQGLAGLHDLFVQAPLLGSLISPIGGDLISPQRLGRIEPLLDRLVEKTRAAEPERAEGAVAARGMADAATILSRRYDLVMTNVPFLGQRRQAVPLSKHLADNFTLGKADLSSAMTLRAIGLTTDAGTVGLVTPQSWYFQSSFERLRGKFLNEYRFDLMAPLGPRAFETITGEVVNTALTIVSRKAALLHDVPILDCNDAGRLEKIERLADGAVQYSAQRAMLEQPSSRLSLVASGAPGKRLLEYCLTYQGIKSGDDFRHLQKFWESNEKPEHWLFMQTTVDRSLLYSGATMRVRWERDGKNLVRGRREGQLAAERYPAVAVTQMSDLPATIMTSKAFDSNVSPLFVRDSKNLAAVYAFCSDPEYRSAVKKLEPSMKANNTTLLEVPFDLDHWTRLAAARFPHGLPAPYSDDPTQWLFHGHPAHAEAGTHLHAALARLAGYRWPAETDPGMRLAQEARDWIAKAATLPQADADGVLPVLAVAGDRPLADRLRDYLNAAIPGWDEAAFVREADERIDKKAGKDLSLEAWLRDRAFRQHSVLFHNRPFLWQVWDGQKDGFSAFLHYHRLDHAALQKLTYTLLGAWIARRKAENDDRRVEAATILQNKLVAILEGEAPFDIFVRWKSLAQQPVGWNPDLDDGVRLNIRPWVEAGVLKEAHPKGIKWGVDRGKDVASAPWFNLDKGERNNDRHTTLAEKLAAREAAAAKVAKG